MAADLSKLSIEDLVALKSGDLSKVSSEGLQFLKGSQSQPILTHGEIAEKIANDPISQGARAVSQATPAELIAANPATRFAMGAASPVLGAAQLGAEALGSSSVSDYLKELEGIKQRGLEAIGGSPAGSVAQGAGIGADIAGNILSPAFLSALKIAPAASIASRVGQGGLIGAAAGAMSPVTSEDYWGSKGGQVLLGTVLGATVPAAIEGGKAVYKGARNISRMFTDEGASKILTGYQAEISGEKNLPTIIDKLKTAPELVSGSKPTAAEVLSQVPEGSPLTGHQEITAKTSGGVSALFGQRKLDQEAAIAAAEKARDVITKPMRDAAIHAADKGGVETNKIINQIDQNLIDPRFGASDLAKKVLTNIKEKLENFTNSRGLIDAESAYAIRKEIGNTINAYSKETANWDKRMTAGLEKKVQEGIDSAIEGAIKDAGVSGNLWKKYLTEYAKRSKEIDATLERQSMMYKPPQKTSLEGGVNVAEATRVHGPQLLSRGMMMTNWVLRKLGENVEKRIDPEAARRYLDPQALASELEKFTPAAKQSVVKDLMDRGYLPAIAASQAQQ